MLPRHEGAVGGEKECPVPTSVQHLESRTARPPDQQGAARSRSRCAFECDDRKSAVDPDIDLSAVLKLENIPTVMARNADSQRLPLPNSPFAATSAARGSTPIRRCSGPMRRCRSGCTSNSFSCTVRTSLFTVTSAVPCTTTPCFSESKCQGFVSKFGFS